VARVGYARVSTADQDLDIQIARLKAAGCEIARSETGSGASREGRGELETVMQFLRGSDELVVLRLDRLGRSTRDVLNLVHELHAKGASLRVLEPEVTTTGDMGSMVITVLGMVADMELKFIKDRQKAGIEAAKADGAYKGRKKRVDDDEIRRLATLGVSKAKIARDLKVSRMTVYRALEMAAAPTEPGKSPFVTVTLHLTIGTFHKRGRGRKPALEHIEAMLERDYAMARLGRCDYQLTVPYGAESDDSNLDSEVNHLQVEMLNIAEGYRCSIETDIREVGGAERVW
jgi:DNA invertase Pin-like site-specific DNA recombinase